ncbi:MAG TPA: metallophosphoesterase [Vicinamibacteria bacterium]
MSFALAALASVLVSGTVYDDANANGLRDAAESGLAGVAVSDGHEVVSTGADGGYRLEASGRNVFVVLPADRRAVGSFWKAVAATADFGLARHAVPAEWRFAHLSDTHVHPGNVERMRRALAGASARGAQFALITGDLNQDALRVDEATARARMELYVREAQAAPLPVFSIPGNHDIFGVERHLSLVPTTHPSYGKAMHEQLVGPRYYSWNRGGVHFIALDTLEVDDLWYYGEIGDEQLAWLRKDLARVPPGTTIVTAGHVPLRTAAVFDGYEAEGPMRSLLTVKGRAFYRHVVRNVPALIEALKPHPLTLALQGHTHEGERLRLYDGTETRYHTAPSVTSTPGLPSGFFVYRVRGGTIDDGERVLLDPQE